MMGIHFMGEVPFEKVYLHAMVRDEKGEKMSKSKGNVIDPLVLIDAHGADPLRFTLAAMAGQGRDIKLSVDRVEGYRAFCNKIWNATKFLHLQFEDEQGGPIPEPAGGTAKWLEDNRAKLTPTNRWILSRLQIVCTRVESGFKKFELNDSAMGLYEFSWHEFCDWYIELSKLSLRTTGEGRVQTIITLHHVLETLMRLMHPVMPFVTEELWLSLPWKKAANTPTRARDGKPEVMTLMFQAFPKENPKWIDAEAERTVAGLKTIIEAIRNFRGENSISPKVEFKVVYTAKENDSKSFMTNFASDIRQLSKVSEIISAEASAPGEFEAVIPLTWPAVDLRISLKGLVNVEEESKRVMKDVERTKSDLDHCRGKLTRESFIAKAPPELIEKERQAEQQLVGKLKELEGALARLAKLK